MMEIIPKSIRNAAGIGYRTKVRFVLDGADIRLIPLKNSFKDFAGYLGKGKLTGKQLDNLYIELMATGDD
ncbi:hypothetical protein HYU15_00345 [Candidatus Woesearchaeota archaeon]|nr:hypothetical protein [Candidatus Woesearchaeota archaeon]